MSAPEAPLTEAMLDGRYRLHECIGEGGMARVLRGEDLILGRTVAIKLFRPDVDAASATMRARSEVSVLAALNHPSLVTLFDAQLSSPPGYMVMEFVAGPTLAALLTRGALPPAQVAGLAADLAEGLHVVHGTGIVHRDIKPSNVLIAGAPLPGARARAKLADFGIACLLDTARVTAPGVVVGTAAYISPEQVRGAEPSPASDIYSLGLVLLEALTGSRAFPQIEGVASALARLSAPPVIPASLGAPWTSLLARMTHMDAQQRPTAAEVAEVVTGLASGSTGGVNTRVVATRTAELNLPPVAPVPPVAEPVAEPPSEPVAASGRMTSASDPVTRVLGSPSTDSSPARSATRPPRQRRRAISIAAGLAVLAATAGGAVGMLISGADTAPRQVSTVRVVTETSTDPSPAPEADVVSGDDGGATPVVPAATDEAAVRDGGRAERDAPAQTSEQAKAAEKAQGEQAKAAEKAQREQAKAAEKAQKQTEKEQRERAKQAREDAEDAQAGRDEKAGERLEDGD